MENETQKPQIRLQYDEELPIVQRRNEIVDLIRKNQVLVVCGETGSGKSTQLPKFLLEMGRGTKGIIGHTQPRRIAARSVAARIAEELEIPLGQTVGYQVRFEEKISPDTRIKVMTDGILLAETVSDRSFRKYDTIIIDEAHERSLNIDFLLGMFKRILPMRQDLKLIITSATLDAKRFAAFFSEPKINRGTPVPVIEVSGRMFPIEIRYRPLDEFEQTESDDGQGIVSRETELEQRAVLAAADELTKHSKINGSGDILIFLPTERDILETAKALRQHHFAGDDSVRKTEILPLYARLPMSEQQKVFQKIGKRKIVLATNVAESSLTVPGIRYVIDTGTARISRYSARTRMQRLPVESVSRASADQRAGRCGRIGDGVCIRLYSETDYRSRQQYTTPEIQRTNLASVILQTLTLRLGKIEHFPFLEPPKKSAITDGYQTLFEIGAIDEQQKLTPLGWKLSKLPVDPRIGRMILAAMENGVLNEMLIIAAVLEIQDPRERPLQQQEKADAAHRKFLDSRSDYLGYLKIWDFYQHLKENTSRNGLRKACQQNFLSHNRMREWNDIQIQLRRELKLQKDDASESVPARTAKTADEFYSSLHRSILAGNLSGIAQRFNKSEYLVCNSGGNSTERFILWLGSGLTKSSPDEDDAPPQAARAVIEKPKAAGAVVEKRQAAGGIVKKSLPHWIIAQERIETSRRYLRTAAQIESSWLEPLTQHLLKRTFQEPYWDAQTGYVHAFERVSLLGIVIVPRRRINFGPIDPKISRDIFIQYALVEGTLNTELAFWANNKEVLDEAKSLQDKLRNYDVLRPQTAQYEFYQQRLPAEVFDQRSLEKWAKQNVNNGTNNEQQLYFSLRNLCNTDLPDNILQKFPDKLETFSGGAAKVEYRYAPDEEADGVTVVVPKEGLKQLNPNQLGWLVPGLLEQKITALLKSLPKELRRLIVPIPDTARTLVKEINFGQGKIEEQLARLVSKLAGRLLTPADFNAEKVPRELQMNVRVLNEDGQSIGEGRNLDLLRKEFGVKISDTINIQNTQWSRSGITDWDFGTLPEYVEIERAGIKIKAFPMLYVSRETGTGKYKDVISLGLADSSVQALRQTQRAVVQLFCLSSHRELLRQINNLPNVHQLRIYAQGIPDFDFQTDFSLLLAARCLEIDTLPVPRNKIEYQQHSKKGLEHLGLAVQELTKWIGSFLESFHLARLSLERNKNIRDKSAYEEAAEHFRQLTETDFLFNTSWQFLKEYPRYFKAIPLRFEKLTVNASFGSKAVEEIIRFRQQYEKQLELHRNSGIIDPELETFRWMLEEYRVSLFAQQLGTVMKVSPQRLDKQFEKVQR